MGGRSSDVPAGWRGDRVRDRPNPRPSHHPVSGGEPTARPHCSCLFRVADTDTLGKPDRDNLNLADPVQSGPVRLYRFAAATGGHSTGSNDFR